MTSGLISQLQTWSTKDRGVSLMVQVVSCHETEPSSLQTESLSGFGATMLRPLPPCSVFEEAGSVGAQNAVRQNIQRPLRHTVRH